MEQQCREIELYRVRVMVQEKRVLTLEEAAFELIDRFAADFDQNYRSGN